MLKPVGGRTSGSAQGGRSRCGATGPGDVLDLIRHGRATTRGDVLEATGLSRDDHQPAARRAARGGMIVEGETNEATGGRRRRSLAFNT